VLRTVCVRPTLWEAMLPPEALMMPPELEAVDVLLDDPRFFEPFRRWFDPTFGRPSIPMESPGRRQLRRTRQMAHRGRGQNRRFEAPTRMGTSAAAQSRRRSNLVRLGRPQPQRDQDRCALQLTPGDNITDRHRPPASPRPQAEFRSATTTRLHVAAHVTTYYFRGK